MGSSANTEYCAFTKAVEHLGDRWCLLIVRELAKFGPQGFNALASGLPGHISRSVLSERLRRLEELGIVERGSGSARQAAYRLAPAGEQLVPTMKSLLHWAEHWVPQDPAMAERDPSVVTAWLKHRVDTRDLPPAQVAIEIDFRGALDQKCWLLLSRDSDPTICLEDPQLDQERYVYVEADVAAVYPIARGARGWRDAIRDGSVQVFGDPQLMRDLPTWFKAVEEPIPMPEPAVA